MAANLDLFDEIEFGIRRAADLEKFHETYTNFRTLDVGEEDNITIYEAGCSGLLDIRSQKDLDSAFDDNRVGFEDFSARVDEYGGGAMARIRKDNDRIVEFRHTEGERKEPNQQLQNIEGFIEVKRIEGKGTFYAFHRGPTPTTKAADRR